MKPASKKKIDRAKKDGRGVKTRFIANSLALTIFYLVVYFGIKTQNKNYARIECLEDCWIVLGCITIVVSIALIIRCLFILLYKQVEGGFRFKFSSTLSPAIALSKIKKNFVFELTRSFIVFLWILLIGTILMVQFNWEKTVALSGLGLIIGLGGLERFFMVRRFYGDLEMTDFEVKQESKESGINPEVRSHLNRVSKTLNRQQALSSASFIVVVRKDL